MGAGGIFSRETDAGVGLVMGGILSKEVENGVGTDAGLGLVLVEVMPVWVGGGQRSGTTATGGRVLFKSIDVGLERVVDIEPGVGVDGVTFVIVVEKTGAGEEGLVVTVRAGDTVTGAVTSPAAELWRGLLEEEVCSFKLLPESNLAGGGWVKETGVGGLWVTGGGLAEARRRVASGLGLLTEAIV